ncbi:F0F1 ATP synthase subunit gamma [Fodinicola acaciae]|uniref:F0F1 ATP synthase subunit gamma n=1 Tax=Fodinicola acaciae TaxID=2681555 RepID=UPI0013CF6D42|nr:F0F1 ATP synthase subunit gamma [Fodinicola acaciae]
MPANVRVIRDRVRSVQSIKKITRAQELIAASRIVKARQRVEAALPYTREITRVLTALATNASNLSHPLLVPRERVRRAGVLVVTSDRGFAGGYNANVIRTAERLISRLRDEGVEPVLFVIGRKGRAYYTFRNREIAAVWTGFSERPGFENAQAAGEALIAAFNAGGDAVVPAAELGNASNDIPGIDQLHVVSTEFNSMVSQTPAARIVAPMEVEYAEGDGERKLLADYEFEPEADELLAAILPKYVNTRIFAALLSAAASESAARQQAMKSATDNAEELTKSLSREANQARQAQITQEISEIVGGANALAASGSED